MENSLAGLGELSKPATVLIEKVSDAVGGICKPWQIVRVAKAEAEAERIQAQSQIEITDMQRRTMHRFLTEEVKKQTNIEGITAKALPLLSDDSSPQDLQDDWIANFFEKSRIVSDEIMQSLWARLLAGEANMPGSFSRKTVNIISDLEKRDAELFTNLCGFNWNIGDLFPLVLDLNLGFYEKRGLNYESLAHLEVLGLVKMNQVSEFSRIHLPKYLVFSYFGRRVKITLPKDNENDMRLGKVLFSQAGKELARVCTSSPVEGFFEYVLSAWRNQSYLIDVEPQQSSVSEKQ